MDAESDSSGVAENTVRLEEAPNNEGPSPGPSSRMARRQRRFLGRQQEFSENNAAVDEPGSEAPQGHRVTGFREVTDANGEISFEFEHSDSEDSDDSDFVLPFPENLAVSASVPSSFVPSDVSSSDSFSDEDVEFNLVLGPGGIIEPASSSDSDEEDLDFVVGPVRRNRILQESSRLSSADEVEMPLESSEDEAEVGIVTPARVQRRRRGQKRKIVRKKKKTIKLTPLAPKTIRRKDDPVNAARYLKNISDDCLKQKCNIEFEFPVSSKSEDVDYVLGSASLTVLDCEDDRSYSRETIKEVFPELTELVLYISKIPTRSVLVFKSERIVDEEEAARIPKPTSMSMTEFRRRKLNYIVEKRKFYNIELNHIVPEVVQGISNKSLFRLQFVRFDVNIARLEFDIILLNSAIASQHNISDMPMKRPLVAHALEYFFSLDSTTRPFANMDKAKEDIDWFYGQIRKYHELESLTEPQFAMQHPSMIPCLREYQKKAVHWMLHREGAIPGSCEPATDLLERFLGKMYVQVSLTRTDTGAVDQAFYNTFLGYICWDRPILSTVQTGGILADEMGLGKTVEVLSLILLNQRSATSSVRIKVDENISDINEEVTSKEVNRRRKRKSGTSRKSELDDTNSDCAIREQFLHPSLRKKRCISPCEFAANITSELDMVISESPEHHSLMVEMDIGVEVEDLEVEVEQEVPNEEETITVETNFKPQPKGKRNQKQKQRKTKKRNWSKPKIRKKNVSVEIKNKQKQAPVSLPKKETTYDIVKLRYDVELGFYSESKNATIQPRFHGEFFNPNIAARAFFECICGRDDVRESDIGIASCIKCTSSQHLACVGLSRVPDMENALKEYLCPHCSAASAPVDAKATLIISPSTISHQWINEIQRHVKDQHLKILLYKGVSKQGYIPPSKLAEYDIVITTYAVLTKEIDYVGLPHSNSTEGRKYRNPKRYATIPSPLPSVCWWRVCLDEAQMVESSSTKMAEMAMTLKAVHRWCVTGTPINKGLDDLYGLIAFLGISPINEEYWWKCLVRDAFYRKEPELLYELFGQIIWRTGKADVLDQLGIPPQSQLVHWLNFSPVETHFYKRHHDMCSTRILEKINRISQAMPQAVDLTLSALDRNTLHDLLAPFLELRQACCHPQMVKGHSFAINKLTGTLTMEQLLKQLIQKTVIQCAEDHRLVVASLNGSAGIHYILEQFPQASDKYREVLQLAGKYESRFSTDTLQLLHTLENLADIVDRNYPGVAYTLRDDDLRSDAEELKKKYLQKYADGVKEANISAERTTKAVELLRDKFQCKNHSWWVSVLHRASKLQKVDDLVARIKDDLIVYATKKKHSGSLANKFNEASGLEHNLVNNITEMESLRITILDALTDIQKCEPHSFLNDAVACHIGKGSIDFCKSNSNNGFLCRLCKNVETFYKYESILYTEQEKKEKIDRTGRNYQKKKLTGSLNRMTEEEERLTLMREQEELLETTEHVNLGMVTFGAASWRDSDTEKALKQLLSFGKLNGCGEMVIQDGSIHMKLLQAMKMEFKVLRVLWSQIFDRISAIDELNQATTRLRLRSEYERNTAGPSTSKNIKSLASGSEARKQKIANINVLEVHDLQPKLREMELECVTAKSDFNVHMGQVLYLETLEKKGYGKTGSSNLEECPICQIGLGSEWCVLLCGHSFCSECVKKMCTNQQQQSFLCPLCRQSIKVVEVSFVDTSVEEAPVDAPVPRGPKVVRGSHSTKVEGIVEKLLKLQDEEPGEKVLIFSTWSEVLGIISKALEENDIKYCTLTTGGKTFQTNLERFKSRDDIQVLLMLITSGSKGLNIIEATHVFLVEPILNLASELQAIGRVHRIGQTKPTFVHRFYVKKTIEEQLQEVLKTQDVSNDEESLTITDLKKLVSK